MIDQEFYMVQWRAVFAYPPSYLGPTADTYGPPRDTPEEAQKDRVPRSEETLGWFKGLQTRKITIWKDVE